MIAPADQSPAADPCAQDCAPCDGCCECDTAAEGRHVRLKRVAWVLTAATIAWNSIEAVIAVVSGLIAGSIALVGFGLDSIVEVSSALVIVWRLSRTDADEEARERSEQRAVRLIALSFFAIAAYVTYDAGSRLLGFGEPAEHSTVGLVLVALSLVVMPGLAWAKRRVAAGLGSVSLRADASETMLCTYLSVVVLIGLVANAVFGWWWMDPLAGLAVAGLALHEGRKAWASGELCDDDGCGVVETVMLRCLRLCCPACPIAAYTSLPAAAAGANPSPQAS
jgi:divalent metal cation (Fe/Co/Zn/Cd) transporter